MEGLTIAEAMELIRVNEEAIAVQFQTWLTITFATIVAVFAGRNLLTTLMRWLVTLLYLLASLSVVAMSFYLAEGNAQLLAALASRDVAVAAPVFAGIVFLMLFLVGVATSVYFIHMKPDERHT
jgi:glucan phosphoethanolaminetransferase (alkaline phosphatase superfamily)